MRRRLFRRVAAGGAMVGGVSGIVANLALLGFYDAALRPPGSMNPIGGRSE